MLATGALAISLLAQLLKLLPGSMASSLSAPEPLAATEAADGTGGRVAVLITAAVAFALAAPRAFGTVRALSRVLYARPEQAGGLLIFLVLVFLFSWAVIGAVFWMLLLMSTVLSYFSGTLLLEALETWFSALLSMKILYALVSMVCVLAVGWHFNLLAGLSSLWAVAIATLGLSACLQARSPRS